MLKQRVVHSLEELARLVSELRKEGKKVVVASGSFDIIHVDHIAYLEYAKKQGDILLVLVKGDRAVGLKGEDRPTIKGEERAMTVGALRCVDLVYVAEYDPQAEDTMRYDNEEQRQWLNIFAGVVSAVRPDVWVHEPAPNLQTARDRLFGMYDVQPIPLQRGVHTSSTAIRNKLTGAT